MIHLDLQEEELQLQVPPAGERQPSNIHNIGGHDAKKDIIHSNRNASISKQCRSFHQNSTRVKMFCQDASECQRTKEARRRHQERHDLIQRRNDGDDDMNRTHQGRARADADTNANAHETSGDGDKHSCKTLWITCISLEFQHEHNELSGDGYKNEYAAALQSAILNTRDALRPVLVILNGSRWKQHENENENNNSFNELSPLPEFGVWAESMGVKVIQVFDLSFQDLVFQHFPDYRTNGKIAYYTRLDIPKYVDQYQLFDEPGVCDRHIFYTDNDVIFINPLTRQDMSRLKQKLGVGDDDKKKILMYGQDFLINRPKPSNTGVMLMDVEGFAKEWPNILDWGVKQRNFPEHDQLWLNRYYADPKKWKQQNELLPTYYNWKVYWQLEPNRLEDVQIVHFHGPKPGVGVEAIADCDVEALENLPFVKHAICCDSGKTANSIIPTYRSTTNS